LSEPRHNPIAANWIAFNQQAEWLGGNEFPLFTDAHITGEVTLGPYTFINTIAGMNRQTIKPGVVLRYDFYKEWDHPVFKETDASLYHGGSPPEEIAALASLAMGIRLRAGRSVRRFEPHLDAKGLPEEIGDQTMPVFFAPRSYIIPGVATGEHSMEGLYILRSLPDLTPSQVNTLIRAARLYQDALWLCETEPEFSWLLFVSALESAANEWRLDMGASIERLEISQPALYKVLAAHEDKTLLSLVADTFAPTTGATKKFRDFCMEFVPAAPPERPADWAQFAWDSSHLRKAIEKIYHYRSKALHDGRPFPAPICSAPYRDPSWSAPSETMTALGEHQMGSTWMKKDIPFHLHVFEYITRETIMGWWRSLLPHVPAAVEPPAEEAL
jgi:hypothetical protein